MPFAVKAYLTPFCFSSSGICMAHVLCGELAVKFVSPLHARQPLLRDIQL